MGCAVLAASVSGGLAGWWWARRRGGRQGRDRARRKEAAGERAAPVFTKASAFLFLGFLVAVVVAADAGILPRELRALCDYPNGDRVGHVAIFGVVTFLFTATFGRVLRVGRQAIPLAVVGLIAFATAEEASQQWFPSRSFDPVDLLCNYGGIALGGWAGARWRRRGRTVASSE